MNIIGRSLSSDGIVLGLDVADKQQVLEEAASIVERQHNISRRVVFRALWRREQAGSTPLGYGIAIPHARIAGLREPVLLLVRAKLPVHFGAPNDPPVSLFFFILVPEHANEEHLQILGQVSAMFADKAFRRRLTAATESAGVQRLFSEWADRSR